MERADESDNTPIDIVSPPCLL
eukprot:COSAG03_NODE_10489_length_647_cov_1215.264599_1_plen_21_part_01